MQWLQSLVDEFPTGKALQRSGNLTKEQVSAFFTQGKALFNSPAFKQRLAFEHQQHRDLQASIDLMQRQVFQEQGVQGDFGIAFLAKVRKVFADDAELLRSFYEFVALEEQALDEAELPASEFKRKYAAAAAMQQALEAEAGNLKGLSPAEQQACLAAAMQKLVAAHNVPSGQSVGSNLPAHQSQQQHVHDASCQHGASVQASARPCCAPLAPSVPTPPTVLSGEEQLAFFQSLGRQQEPMQQAAQHQLPGADVLSVEQRFKGS